MHTVEGLAFRVMTEHLDDDRVAGRADHLNPEEVVAGSDDPHRQAEVILEDSDQRTERPEATKHQSSQTPD